MERLDHFVANPSWINSFPTCQVENLDFYELDHKPIRTLINLSPPILNQNHNKRFMFNLSGSLRKIIRHHQIDLEL